MCWYEATFGADAVCVRRAQVVDMSRLVEDMASTGASSMPATVPVDVGLPAMCCLVAFSVLSCSGFQALESSTVSCSSPFARTKQKKLCNVKLARLT